MPRMIDGRPPRRIALALACLGLLCVAHPPRAFAQEGAIPPHWIWTAEKDEPGAEPRYFRKEFAVKEVSRLAVDAAADNAYVLYLDGREIARGQDWKAAQSSTNRIETGRHVLAAVVTNEEPGPAGFLLGGGVLPLGQGVPIHTDASWKGTAEPPAGDDWKLPGFDEAGWAQVADLGAVGVAPWGMIALSSTDTAARFGVPEGFSVAMVAAPGVTGSGVSFAFDHEGRPCVGVERGPIIRLVDGDGDGIYEDKVAITPQMSNCQGIYFDVAADGSGVTLWAIGAGPEGTGIHRLGDEDGDGVFEKVLHYTPTDSMGEHGPHAITRGPDGLLYFNSGNHSHIKADIDPSSPVDATFRYEGELLPHFNDGRGHAAGIMAPGGEIYRSPDDGESWQRVVAGFRNEYDFAFNAAGELFSFDSDMEWDIGLPWYRPVRVAFCPPGAEFGWRNGSGKWPTYYYDSIPGLVNLGRGSPTGVTFYQDDKFPPEYRDAFLYCDWSQGRILASKPVKSGAGYRAGSTELVVGQPLNCTDIEVGPDGAVYFTTGGRGTLGGLYRVAFDSAPKTTAVQGMPAVAHALSLPSPLSAYGRAGIVALKQDAGADWQLGLVATAKDTDAGSAARIRSLDVMTAFGPEATEELLAELARDDDPEVRAKVVQVLGMRSGDEARDLVAAALDDSDPFVRRRACEATVRAGAPIPVERLLPLLDDPDRLVRYAARVAVEHGGPADFRDEILLGKTPRALLEGMLALVRTGRPLDAEARNDLLDRQRALWLGPLAPAERLDLLRLIGLTLLFGPEGTADAPALSAIREGVLADYLARPPAPASTREPIALALDREEARLLAYLDEPRAIVPILDRQAAAADHPLEIHYSYCLRAFDKGWTPATKQRLWAWYEAASRWDGGFSYLGYLDFMVQDLVAQLSPGERASYLASGATYPFPTRTLVRSMDLDESPDAIPTLQAVYLAAGQAPNRQAAEELRGLILEKLGRSERPEAGVALRALALADPTRLGTIVRGLRRGATEADFPLLIAALDADDPDLAAAAARILDRLDARPDGPGPLRNLIRASRRGGGSNAEILSKLARKWYGIEPADGASPGDTIARLEASYRERFPSGPPLEAVAEVEDHDYTLAQLMAAVIRPGLVAKGSPERGRAVLTKARCLDCHKLGAEGSGLGPDLTTLSSRFRPEDILESIVAPSNVISDQYQSVTVATNDGQVYNGMPAGGDDATLILLLSDGTQVNIPKADIDEQAISKVSVMPAGLIDALSPEEIADVLALFEAQPRVETPAPGANPAPPGGH